MKNRTDKERMDFLADPNQYVAHVLLPRHAVVKSLHSMRDAIDQAMDEFEENSK